MELWPFPLGVPSQATGNQHAWRPRHLSRRRQGRTAGLREARLQEGGSGNRALPWAGCWATGGATVSKHHRLDNNKVPAQWYTLMIPVTWEAEAGGLQVCGQPEQCSKTLPQNFKKRAGNVA